MKLLIIDASVAIKWFLDDEKEIGKAQQILADRKQKKVEFILPSIWIYEVANGFRSAVIKKRISAEEAKQYTKEVKLIQFPLTDTSLLIDKVTEVALNFDISVYDAAYVTLAQKENCAFITGDRKLFNKLKSKLSFIKWIGDY